ncbi:MAG: fatty acid desaturase [Gemmataceae bacterium]
MDATEIDVLADPRVKEKLQELRQTDNFRNVPYLIRTYLFLVLVIGATVAFHQTQMTQGWHWAWNLPAFLVAIVLVGAGQHQLTGLAHEASHHLLFANRYANDLLADWLCMFPLFGSIQHYRLQHLAHHQFVNDPNHDPDVSQLQTSGHWLDFPIERAKFVATLIRQLWPINLFRYMRIRAAYNAIPTDKNPYLKKGWKPTKMTVRLGILYIVGQLALTATLVWLEQPLLLAIIPPALWAGAMLLFGRLPDTMYHQSRVHPIISMRSMTLMRLTYVTILFQTLGWLSLYVTPYAGMYWLVLWVVPIFTSFSFFMILRQIVQHGNGDRGKLNNTRVFRVHPFLRQAVFPMGQDYHLPHHLFSSIPHYRLRELHEFLMRCKEYRAEAIEVEGYFYPYSQLSVKPTVVDVLGPRYSRRAEDVFIDDDVLANDEIDERDEILRKGAEERRKRKEETAK